MHIEIFIIIIICQCSVLSPVCACCGTVRMFLAKAWSYLTNKSTRIHTHKDTSTHSHIHTRITSFKFIWLGKIGVYCAICHAHATHTTTQPSISPIEQHTLRWIWTVNCCEQCASMYTLLYVLVFSSYLFAAWRIIILWKKKNSIIFFHSTTFFGPIAITVISMIIDEKNPFIQPNWCTTLKMQTRAIVALDTRIPH